MNYIVFLLKYINFSKISLFVLQASLHTLFRKTAKKAQKKPPSDNIRYQITGAYFYLYFLVIQLSNVIQQFAVGGERPAVFIYQHFQFVRRLSQILHGSEYIITTEDCLRFAVTL